MAEFLGTLHTDVKLLLVAGALALLAALLSATKKNEHRYVALFTVFMLAAGYRFHVHQGEDAPVATADAPARTRNSARPPEPAKR